MKEKILPVLVVFLLIMIVGGAAAGVYLYKKYSYSKEEMDMYQYYEVNADGEECAIILQDERMGGEDTALVRGGVCYFKLDTVKGYFNDTFYWDENEKKLLYTTATSTAMAEEGKAEYGVKSNPVQSADGTVGTGYIPVVEEDGIVYVAADYVKLFTNYSYEVFDLHVQVYTEWGEKDTASIRKDTAVRYRGGVKSPVLRQLVQGEKVEILEDLGDWSKVKTSDSIIGYVENKRLEDYAVEEEEPVTSYQAPAYTSLKLPGKVNLGFHSIGGVGGNITLEDMLNEGKGINVIAPSWFSVVDDNGNIRSFGDASYVAQAHGRGVSVWGVVDNFNYELETGVSLDILNVLSSTTKRNALTQNIMAEALRLGLDGINVDFENLSMDCREPYAQFIRELSVECRANGLYLSFDNYVPYNFNEHYRLDVQADCADYVIIMGYDEHWHGSQDPGSVASIDYVAYGIDKAMESVPAEKIVNALPLYMILWRIEGSSVTDDYVTMNNLTDLLNSLSAEPAWDETTCQNYVEWNQGSARYEMWIEDEKSISVKLNVMASKEIGGVAVWRLGYGTKAVWELINLYVNNM